MSHDEVAGLKEWMVRIEADGKATLALCNKIYAEGCSRRGDHETKAEDQEKRLRVVEDWISTSTGKMVGVGLVLVPVVGVLGWGVEEVMTYLGK